MATTEVAAHRKWKSSPSPRTYTCQWPIGSTLSIRFAGTYIELTLSCQLTAQGRRNRDAERAAGSGYNWAMTIADGYHDLPSGRIAAIVTYLEMRTPQRVDVPIPPGVEITRLHGEDPALYRELFRAVGEPWLWFSRLHMTDAELRALLTSPQVEVYTLHSQGIPSGLLELDFRESPDVELAFFGLTASMIGQGAGRYLMQFAIERAFSRHPARLFLHTCTLDHPKALGFYQKAGFRAYKRAVEVAPDPRLTGRLSRTAAPLLPIIE